MNKYMNVAYQQALKAYKKQEVPVGAIIIKNGKIIAKAKNNRQKHHNLLGHAEINCILKAEKKLKDWRLDDCEMYVTLAPCEMCNCFIKESRIKKVYYLAARSDNEDKPSIYIQTNDCEKLFDDYQKILLSFFEDLRK